MFLPRHKPGLEYIVSCKIAEPGGLAREKGVLNVARGIVNQEVNKSENGLNRAAAALFFLLQYVSTYLPNFVLAFVRFSFELANANKPILYRTNLISLSALELQQTRWIALYNILHLAAVPSTMHPWPCCCTSWRIYISSAFCSIVYRLSLSIYA